MSQHTPDSWIESEENGGICDDAGYCNRCHNHLDEGKCDCTDEEREAAPSLQEQEENAEHDRGEQAYLDACDERGVYDERDGGFNNRADFSADP